MQNELVAPHNVDRRTEHYAAVKAEMAKRGECVIRALWSDELLVRDRRIAPMRGG